ncbi:MAG: MBL fold metallo-hydrolase [Planctomycetes bacterium]|nr:MBL fold metallo-hydrolase [Planctomycetota bacterium]MBL7007515.1 MBL fold metallo-hydrolase [Planctomycetota bacterium]
MSKLEIHEVPVTPFQQNCTVLVCADTGAAAVCDCGDAGPVLALLGKLGVEASMILATHGHLDHVGGTAELKRATGLDFWYPPADDMWLERLQHQVQLYGWGPVETPRYEHELHGGDRLQLGHAELEVRHCPGHTPGHVIFVDAAGAQMVAGDVIFSGSVGRTDFPGGSWEQLERSIREQVYSLPDDTLIHCGHGPTTTVGREAMTNPFVRR